jgi:hypothetical protein
MKQTTLPCWSENVWVISMTHMWHLKEKLISTFESRNSIECHFIHPNDSTLTQFAKRHDVCSWIESQIHSLLVACFQFTSFSNVLLQWLLFTWWNNGRDWKLCQIAFDSRAIVNENWQNLSGL